MFQIRVLCVLFFRYQFYLYYVSDTSSMCAVFQIGVLCVLCFRYEFYVCYVSERLDELSKKFQGPPGQAGVGKPGKPGPPGLQGIPGGLYFSVLKIFSIIFVYVFVYVLAIC